MGLPIFQIDAPSAKSGNTMKGLGPKRKLPPDPERFQLLISGALEPVHALERAKERAARELGMPLSIRIL